MAETQSTTEAEQRRYNRHVEYVTEMIAETVESVDAVSEVNHGGGVIHVHMKPGRGLDEPVLLPLTEQGARLGRVELRDGDSTVARLYARFVVSDERLREGWVPKAGEGDSA